MPNGPVFVAGGTGYIGRPLVVALVACGRSVRALVRRGSAGKLPAAAVPVVGRVVEVPEIRGSHQ